MADVMTPSPFTVAADDRVGVVQAAMLESGVHCVPVLDDEGHSIGIVSSWDLVDDHPPDDRIEQTMTTKVVQVGEAETIPEAAALMRSNFIHHLVVVDEAGGVIGVLSSMDLVAHFVDE